PRLAVLQAWYDTQSAGWVRMIFDEEKIPYTVVMDDDVKKGLLRERFDVIGYPDTGRSLKDIATPPTGAPPSRSPPSPRATARPRRRPTSPAGSRGRVSRTSRPSCARAAC